MPDLIKPYSKSTLPKLYGLTSTGVTKVWCIDVIEIGDDCVLETTRGLFEGKQTSTRSSVIKGKNIGKKNETSNREQALLEAASKWSKKIDEGYLEYHAFAQGVTETSASTPSALLPMLAHVYSKRKHDIIWPCALQPKLNGIRCLASKVSETEIVYTSRGGKRFNTLGHLTPELLMKLNVGEIFDGEIYKRGTPLQDISAAVKREKKEHDLLRTLEYWIYDVIDLKATFKDRFYSKSFVKREAPIGKVHLVPTIIARNETELYMIHGINVANKYEGTMVRNLDSLYVLNYRSCNLQKLKDFQEEEFMIVGGQEASGEDEGTVVFTCATKDGGVFNVRPEGTREYRAKLFSELESLIGKSLTVRFQDLTNDNIPTFPVGVVIRDYE